MLLNNRKQNSQNFVLIFQSTIIPLLIFISLGRCAIYSLYNFSIGSINCQDVGEDDDGVSDSDEDLNNNGKIQQITPNNYQIL